MSRSLLEDPSAFCCCRRHEIAVEALSSSEMAIWKPEEVQTLRERATVLYKHRQTYYISHCGRLETRTVSMNSL